MRKEIRSFSRRSEIGLGDDLDEWHAAAVEIEVRLARRVAEHFVQRLAGVLFEVHPPDADAPADPAAGVFDGAASRERLLILRDLVALRQVRIEVILAREERRLV